MLTYIHTVNHTIFNYLKICIGQNRWNVLHYVIFVGETVQYLSASNITNKGCMCNKIEFSEKRGPNKIPSRIGNFKILFVCPNIVINGTPLLKEFYYNSSFSIGIVCLLCTVT